VYFCNNNESFDDKSIPLGLKELKAGIYFLKIFSDKFDIVKKIIKN